MDEKERKHAWDNGYENGLSEGRRQMAEEVREVLSEAHRDIGEWIQLAHRQREMMNQDLGWCPTEGGIRSSEEIRKAIGKLLAPPDAEKEEQ